MFSLLKTVILEIADSHLVKMFAFMLLPFKLYAE